MDPGTSSGRMHAVVPSTNAILVILDPKAFPSASPGLPSKAATAETSSSGADVPIDTMVRPIRKWLMPSREARLAAPSTNLSALMTVSAMPRTTATVAQIMR